MKDEKTIETETDFGRLVHRMNRAYGCFLMWKYIRKSISVPESGQKEAERRGGVMNRYGGIFTGVLYSTENAFITDLHKFFDKSANSLKLETLIHKLPTGDKKEAESLLASLEREIERIKILRHNFTAHEPKNPEEEKIFTMEIEKVFSVVQQVINIISKSIGGEFMTWELWENSTNESFTHLLDDLELGHNNRIQKS